MFFPLVRYLEFHQTKTWAEAERLSGSISMDVYFSKSHGNTIFTFTCWQTQHKRLGLPLSLSENGNLILEDTDIIFQEPMTKKNIIIHLDSKQA